MYYSGAGGTARPLEARHYSQLAARRATSKNGKQTAEFTLGRVWLLPTFFFRFWFYFHLVTFIARFSLPTILASFFSFLFFLSFVFLVSTAGLPRSGWSCELRESSKDIQISM